MRATHSTFATHCSPSIPLSQLWITSESGATIRPTVPSEPLLTVRTGSPLVHISRLRLVGGIKVEGGDLELTDCSIEAEESTNTQEGAAGRLLSPAAGVERPLSIAGGNVRLVQCVLTGHAAGAISAQAARLTMIESSVQGNRARFGGAIRVSCDSMARLDRSNLTDNAADESGGALQVCNATFE